MQSAERSATSALAVGQLLALCALALLAGINYLILGSQIEATEPLTTVVNISGRQRALLLRSFLLAQQLVDPESTAKRGRLRVDLHAAIATMEAAHFRLYRPDADSHIDPPAGVLEIYDKTPWLLDSEMRNFVVQARALANAPDDELNESNPHFQYLRQATLDGQMIEALEHVVAAYQQQSDQKNAQLTWLTRWSVLAMVGLLGLTGALVFQPLMHRVRKNIEGLAEFNDVLERRVAERTAEAERRAQELAESEAALRKQSRILQSILDSMGDGVLVADTQKNFVLFNPAARKILKVDSIHVTPSVWSAAWTEQYGVRIYLPDGESYPQDELPLARAMRGESVDDAEMVLRWTGSTDSAWLSTTARPLRDESGLLLGGVAVIRDVTEKKQAQRRLLQSERLAAIGEMVAGVAHESRNALQQIQACSQMLSWEVSADSEAQGLITDLQKSQDRLTRLFEHLRGYVSPIVLKRRKLDVRQPMHEAWHSVSQLQDGREVSFREQILADDLVCTIDPFLLEQVFRNLLENSLAACDGPISIEIAYGDTCLEQHAAVSILVRDNGPGLSDEQKRRLFEAFYSTKSQGTGLGMAIAKRIVEAHGGRIEVGADCFHGAEIKITLKKGNP